MKFALENYTPVWERKEREKKKELESFCVDAGVVRQGGVKVSEEAKGIVRL